MSIISGGNVIPGAHSRIIAIAGAPTSGAAGTGAGSAQPGALLVDTTNGDLYINTNTSASPSWSLLADLGVVPAARLEAAALDGTVAKVLAAGNVIGGLPVVHRITVLDATGNNDVVLTHKTLILDAWMLATGIGAHATLDTWQLRNGANVISDAVAKTATVNKISRVNTLDPAQATIAAAGTLRIAAVKDTNAAGVVTVIGVRVA